MIKAEMDMPELQRNLRKFSKSFGETNAQAVIRWSVQTCRELAFGTTVWGKKTNTDGHRKAIRWDIFNVTLVKKKLPRKSTNSRIIRDAGELVEWVNLNRIRRGARTSVLPYSERKICNYTVFNKAVAMKMKRAGMAKGGFIGAGKSIARAQKGVKKMTIGKNYFGYAHKHAHFGSATKPKPSTKPTAKISNRVAHTSEEYVIKKATIKKSIKEGLRNTLAWYKAALRRQNRKQK